MADEIDKTTDRDEIEAPARLLASRRPIGPEPTGHCLWCEASVEHPRRWCDAECRNEWERRR